MFLAVSGFYPIGMSGDLARRRVVNITRIAPTRSPSSAFHGDFTDLPQGSFISYESAMSKTFSPLDDGKMPPQRKEFQDASFDQERQNFE